MSATEPQGRSEAGFVRAAYSTLDDELAAELTAHAAHLQRLSQRLDYVVDEVAMLTANVDQLTRTADAFQEAPERMTGTGPPCWATMTAEAAAHAWEELAHWIDAVFVPWYAITRDQLPDCWALHRPAVVELSWLHHTYRTAYRAAAGPHLAAEWHTHWKPAALRAIHAAIPRRGRLTCTPGRHLSSGDERLPTPGIGVPDRMPARALAPSEEPASRQHWAPWFDRAVNEDIARRR